MKHRISFAVFFAGGLAFSAFTFSLLMWAVWGAPTHPVQYVALFSSVGLVLSSFVCLFAPAGGRALATISLVGMGAFYIPAASALVPAATPQVGPTGYVVVLGYFVLLAFALFYPQRWRVSVPLFVACFLASSAFAATTYVQRAESGDMRWPSLAYFDWVPGAAGLEVAGDRDGWITTAARDVLLQHGITGALRWSGAQGYPMTEPRILVLCQSQIFVPKELRYPKRGTVIYVFDGSDWTSIPERPDTFPAHATIRPDGMIEQVTPGGGRRASAAFHWP